MYPQFKPENCKVSDMSSNENIQKIIRELQNLQLYVIQTVSKPIVSLTKNLD